VQTPRAAPTITSVEALTETIELRAEQWELEAIDEYTAEGEWRAGARYARNHEILVDGMEALGGS
jgi:hypothetical protein